MGVALHTRIGVLLGCVNDARAVAAGPGPSMDVGLEGAFNFPSPRLVTATGPRDLLPRIQVANAPKDLFNGDDHEVALFYFAGHGHIQATAGYAGGATAASALPEGALVGIRPCR